MHKVKQLSSNKQVRLQQLKMLYAQYTTKKLKQALLYKDTIVLQQYTTKLDTVPVQNNDVQLNFCYDDRFVRY